MSKQSTETKTNRPAGPDRRAGPVHEIRIGLIKAAIWANRVEDRILHNVTFERCYKEGEVWKTTLSFGRDDLLTLAKVADQAHSFITKAGAKSGLEKGRLPKG